jgi:hypothetical protein
VLTYNHSLQPTNINDNVNQFKVGLESGTVSANYETEKHQYFSIVSLPTDSVIVDHAVCSKLHLKPNFYRCNGGHGISDDLSFD